MGLIHEDKTYALKIRESADDGSDFSSPEADYRMLFLGEDGFLHVKDSAGTVTDAYEAGGAAVGNLWTMSKTTSQTLTNGGTDTITWDTAQIDGGGSVIDLANERFVAPATGLYMAYATWLWETTAPAGSAYMSARVGGADVASLVRTSATNGANGGLFGSWPLSLTAGDFVTLIISPSTITGVTARGNAAVQIRTSFTLVRIT